MIRSEQKNRRRQHHALRTLTTAVLILFGLSFFSSCHHEEYGSIDATLNGGLKTRIMGTDGNFLSPSYAPASRGALITTENFGTYYSSFGFQAIRQDSMKVCVSASMVDKDSTGTNSNFYEHFYAPDTGDMSWPSKKNNDGTSTFVPLSFFCYAGDTNFAPTVAAAGGASTATLTGYTVPTDVSKQKDCLIGITNFVTPEIKGSGEDAEFTASAFIYFSHALTAINFEVGTITPGITIDSLTISGIYGKGTLTANRTIGSANTSGTSEYYKKDDKTTTDKNEDEIVWTPSGSANASYTTVVGFEIIGDDDPDDRDATKQAAYDGSGKIITHGAMLDTTKVEAHSFILLPQKVTDAKLTVKYTYKGVKYTQTADIKDYTWKRSNKYIYAINLTLQEFGFTLYAKEWADGGDFPENGYNW